MSGPSSRSSASGLRGRRRQRRRPSSAPSSTRSYGAFTTSSTLVRPQWLGAASAAHLARAQTFLVACGARVTSLLARTEGSAINPTGSVIEQRFRWPQYIHRTGQALVQVVDDRDGTKALLFEKNRFFTTKYVRSSRIGPAAVSS